MERESKLAEALRGKDMSGLIDALRHQRQIDAHGTEVGVSRQAVDEAAEILDALAAHDAREGEVAIDGERCVICAASVLPKDQGLCDAHKYDEQTIKARETTPTTLEHLLAWFTKMRERRLLFKGMDDHDLDAVILSLEAAIAARGEAVATVHETLNGNFWIEWHRQPMTHYVEQPLYTAPPAPQVDEAMVERASEASWPIAKSSMESTDWNEIGGPRREHHKRVVRAAIQAALEVPNV